MKKRGPPEIAYCNSWKPKSDQLRHEVLLTDLLLSYPSADVVRGWKVDQRLRPDAEMTLDGRKFYVELDTGHLNHRRVSDRLRNYQGVKDYLLFVTLSERRLPRLIADAQSVREIALFATLDAIMREPRGMIWIDAFGNRTSL